MTFTQAEIAGFLAFLIDLALAPASVLILILALVFANSGRRWAVSLGVVAGLNLLVSSTMLATIGDGLSWVVWLVVLQAIVSAALLVIVMRRRWRAAVFGRRTTKR